MNKSDKIIASAMLYHNNIIRAGRLAAQKIQDEAMAVGANIVSESKKKASQVVSESRTKGADIVRTATAKWNDHRARIITEINNRFEKAVNEIESITTDNIKELLSKLGYFLNKLKNIVDEVDNVSTSVNSRISKQIDFIFQAQKEAVSSVQYTITRLKRLLNQPIDVSNTNAQLILVTFKKKISTIVQSLNKNILSNTIDKPGSRINNFIIDKTGHVSHIITTQFSNMTEKMKRELLSVSSKFIFVVVKSVTCGLLGCEFWHKHWKLLLTKMSRLRSQL